MLAWCQSVLSHYPSYFPKNWPLYGIPALGVNLPGTDWTKENVEKLLSNLASSGITLSLLELPFLADRPIRCVDAAWFADCVGSRMCYGVIFHLSTFLSFLALCAIHSRYSDGGMGRRPLSWHVVFRPANAGAFRENAPHSYHSLRNCYEMPQCFLILKCSQVSFSSPSSPLY